MKHLLQGTGASVRTKNKSKSKQRSSSTERSRRDDDNKSKTSRDHQQNLRNLVETWMKRGSELAAKKEYYEALEEFKTLQERLLTPELTKTENRSTNKSSGGSSKASTGASSTVSSRFLWATRQNADVDFVVGRLHERLGQEEEAAKRYKLAYTTFEKLPDLCLQQRKQMQREQRYEQNEQEHRSIDNYSESTRSRHGHGSNKYSHVENSSSAKSKGNKLRRGSGFLKKSSNGSTSPQKSQIQNHKALVFHADTQSILVLEAMGSLAVKRHKPDLATEFYDMVDALIRKTEVKYGVSKLDGNNKDGRQLPEYDDDDDDASSLSSDGSLTYNATDDLREYRKDRAKRIRHVKRLVEEDRSRTSKIFASQMENDDGTVLGVIGSTIMKWLGDS